MNKMVNEHTMDYHPRPSELNSRIHPLIFLWFPQGFYLSPDFLLNFFSNLNIPPWLAKNLKFMVLRLLENALVSQKTKFILTHAPKQNSGSYHPPLGRRKLPISPAERGEETMKEVKQKSKIKLVRVVDMSFEKFHHFKHAEA